MLHRPALAGVLLAVAGLLAAPGASARSVQPSGTPITAADIADLAQVGDPQISPDGRRIAYTVATPQAGGQPPLSRIHLVSADGDGPAQALPAPPGADDRQPQWSADGGTLLFLSNRPVAGAVDDAGLAQIQVWRVDADGRSPSPLSRSGSDVQGFALAPDGSRLAWRALDPQSEAERSRLQARDDAHVVEQPGRRSRLWLRDLDTGAVQALTPPGLQVHDLAWSPDARTLALRISEGTTLNDFWYRSRVVLVDAGSGALVRTVCERASAFPLQFSPDGRYLVYGRLGPYGMTAQAQVQPVDGGEPVALAADWPGTLWLARWRDADTLVGQGQRGVRGALLQIDAASGRAVEIARPQVPYGSFSVAAGGGVAFIGSRPDMPPEVWTWDGVRLRERTASNPQVADWPRVQLRELSWTSSLDGRRIDGVLVTPGDARPGARLPMLVQIHGGPAWAWWSGWLGSWHDWAYLLASRGYAVLLPNPRGSDGQGATFAQASRGDWGGADFQDVLDGIDLLEHEGVIDPQRLAIGGWSYGGYLSAWAVAHSERFRAAIVGAGIADLGAMALTTDTPDYLPGYFGDPVDRRAIYDAHSPVRHVDRIRVPVLVLHGEADERVPPDQGRMLYRALEMRGMPVELVTYPRGPHWFFEREHGRDVQDRVLAWLDRHLAPPPR